MYGIPGYRESGPADVILGQVGQRLFEFLAPFAVGARYALPCRTGRPDTEKPDPVESRAGESVQVRVGNVVERDRATEVARQLRQPNARVDLAERRIPRGVHIRSRKLASAGA